MDLQNSSSTIHCEDPSWTERGPASSSSNPLWEPKNEQIHEKAQCVLEGSLRSVEERKDSRFSVLKEVNGTTSEPLPNIAAFTLPHTPLEKSSRIQWRFQAENPRTVV